MKNQQTDNSIKKFNKIFNGYESRMNLVDLGINGYKINEENIFKDIDSKSLSTIFRFGGSRKMVVYFCKGSSFIDISTMEPEEANNLMHNSICDVVTLNNTISDANKVSSKSDLTSFQQSCLNDLASLASAQDNLDNEKDNKKAYCTVFCIKDGKMFYRGAVEAICTANKSIFLSTFTSLNLLKEIQQSYDTGMQM